MALRSVQGGVTADYVYSLEPAHDNATKVTLVADCQSDGLVWRALSPLISLAIRLTDGGQLRALKKVVEGA